MVLILPLLANLGRNQSYLPLAIAVLVVTMTCPAIFAPLAKIWFGFSHVLGGFVSKVLLTRVFFSGCNPYRLFTQDRRC